MYCIHNYTIHTTLLQITKYVYINAPPVLLHLHSLQYLLMLLIQHLLRYVKKKCKIVEPETL